MKKQNYFNRILPLFLVFMQVVLLCSFSAIITVAADEPTFDVWDGTVDTAWLSDATEAAKTTHTIDTAAKLAGLAKLTNDAAIGGSTGAYAGHTFYITKNIDLNDKAWSPIGIEYGTNFAGNIEGKLNGTEGASVTIKNMKINATTSNKGFIGTHRGGSLKNITFVDAKVTSTSSSVGVAAGYISKEITAYENIVAVNSTVKGNGQVGGLVGDAKTDNVLTFKNCAYVGGSVFSDMAHTGGIIGKLEKINYNFEGCYVSAKISSEFAAVGGIVGLIDASNTTVSFKNCQFDGMANADAAYACGAFVGSAPVGTVNLENCVSTGLSRSKTLYAWFGLAESGTVINVTNCYSNSNMAISGKVDPTVLDSSKLMGTAAKINLTGLDFEMVWATREGKNPILAYVKENVPDTYGKADLTWFDPSEDTLSVETENELVGMAMLSQLATVADYEISVSDSLRSLMTEALFDKTYLDAYNAAFPVNTTTPDGEDENTDTTVTTAPEDNTAVSTNEGTTAASSEEESGCKSVIGGASVLLLISVGAIGVFFRKKEDQ